MNSPRQYTVEETRKHLIETIWGYIDYWDSRENKTSRQKLAGLAFGILVILDGDSAELPKFSVIPDSHISNKDYNIKRGRNYYSTELKLEYDLTPLHEYFFTYEPSNPNE